MLDCRNRYGDAKTFLVTFNPEAQRHCTPANLRKVYTGNAPALATVTLVYGEDVTDVWLSAQIRDIANFSGVREKLSAETYQSLCNTIKDCYGYLKVSELLLFFKRLKAGEYGRFYGAVDAMLITTGLKSFCEERHSLIDKYLREEEMERRRRALINDPAEQLHRARRVCNMPIQEHLALRREGILLTNQELAEIGWLFRLGYELKTKN